MNNQLLHQEAFVENWYQTAEQLLTNDINKLNKEEIDHLLAEATYTMTDEEAENFFKSLGAIVTKGAKAIAPVVKTLAPIAGTIAGGVIGGPIGAKIGGSLGNAVANIGGNNPANTPSNPRNNHTNIAHNTGANNGSNSGLVTRNTGNANSGHSTPYAPVPNQLLMLINNPDFLLRLLQTITRQGATGTTQASEDFLQDVHTLKLLSEELLKETYSEPYNDSDLGDYLYDDDPYYDELHENFNEYAH